MNEFEVGRRVKVTIEGTVTDVDALTLDDSLANGDYLLVEDDDEWTHAFFRESDMIKVEDVTPAPVFKAGDVARGRNSRALYVIVEVDGELKAHNGAGLNYTITNMELELFARDGKLVS